MKRTFQPNNHRRAKTHGYPRRYEDQEKWQGGWVRKRNGRLVLKRRRAKGRHVLAL